MKRYTIKEVLELIIIFCIFAYVLGAVTEYFFARNLLLLRSNIREADIIFEMDVNAKHYGSYGNHVGPTFIIYFKEQEIGFINTENGRYSFTRHGYSLFSRYNRLAIHTKTGETIPTFPLGKRYYFPDISAIDQDVNLSSHYIYSQYGSPKGKYVYFGVKHDDEFTYNGEQIRPEFLYFLDGVFNGVYVYYFESDEKLDWPIDLTFYRR